MKNIYYLGVLIFLLTACNSPMQIRVKMNGETKMECRLMTSDSSFVIPSDSTAWTVITLPEAGSRGYGSLVYGKQKLPLYFDGSSFDMIVKSDGKVLFADLSGKGERVNAYLTNPSLAHWNPNYKLEEQAFIAMLDSTERVFLRKLDSCGLSKEFEQKEKQRIHYLVQGKYLRYLHMHLNLTCMSIAPSDQYYLQVQAIQVEDEKLLELAEYKTALSEAVLILSMKKYYRKNVTALESLKAKLEYIADSFKEPAVISFLTDHFIILHMKRNGLECQDYFTPIYTARVTDVKSKENFDALYRKWITVAPGQPSPDFCYPDVNDKEVCLKDLIGKYIYIDMWATWCGPCCAEIPALQKLEHRYKDKDIQFVSISSDKNKEAWKKMVIGNGMTGIQLNINSNRDFMNAYLISAIPRFIFLDKEGKIIQADMTRPSDPKTQELLDSLLMK